MISFTCRLSSFSFRLCNFVFCGRGGFLCSDAAAPVFPFQALLEFEERQGAVVSRKLSRREIQRFPTKKFHSAKTAGNTQYVWVVSSFTAHRAPTPVQSSSVSFCLQVSDMFLWLQRWGKAQDAAVFPWLPCPMYRSMVKGKWLKENTIHILFFVVVIEEILLYLPAESTNLTFKVDKLFYFKIFVLKLLGSQEHTRVCFFRTESHNSVLEKQNIHQFLGCLGCFSWCQVLRLQNSQTCQQLEWNMEIFYLK